MACCQKKRNSKTKQLIKRRIFESEGFNLVRHLKRNPPSILQDQLLHDYHKRSHTLYEKAIKFKPANKAFIHHIVQMHDEFGREMLSRGIIHKTPLQRL
jgi:hypothetical protein